MQLLFAVIVIVSTISEANLAKLFTKPIPTKNQQLPPKPERVFSNENIAKFASCDDHCRLGWSYFQNKCIFYDSTPREYDESAVFCKSLGATMVTIQSKEESESIGDLVSPNQWTWLGGETNGTALRDFYWTDHSSNDFTYFTDAVLQPHKGLVIRKDGKWSYSDFDIKRSIICQKAPKKCFPETEARIKITQKVINSLDGNVTRLVDNFLQNQLRLTTDVKRIRSEMNTTGDSIEELINSTNGLQKQIDIIMEYLATLTKTVQRLIAE